MRSGSKIKEQDQVRKCLTANMWVKKAQKQWLRDDLYKYNGERIILGAQDKGITTKAILRLHKKTTPELQILQIPTRVLLPYPLLLQLSPKSGRMHYPTRKSL